MNSGSKPGRSFSALPTTVNVCVVAALLVSAVSIAHGRGSTVEITGNRAVPTERIRRLLPRGGWSNDRDDAVLKRVQQAYIQQGYLFASFHLERRPPDSTLVLFVHEGDAARFGRVRIAGARHFGEAEVRRTLGVESGSRFEPDRLQGAIEELLNSYDGAGFPFAQVWMDSLQLDHSARRVHLTIHVVEGGSRALARVSVQGLKKTREELAVKLSGLRVGDPYDGNLFGQYFSDHHPVAFRMVIPAADDDGP